MKVRLKRYPCNNRSVVSALAKPIDKTDIFNLSINEGKVQLSGPRFAYITRGEILEISTGTGNDYDLHLTVLSETGDTSLARERWFVKFGVTS